MKIRKLKKVTVLEITVTHRIKQKCLKCVCPKLGDGTVDFCLTVCSEYSHKRANSCHLILQRPFSSNFVLYLELMQKKILENI